MIRHKRTIEQKFKAIVAMIVAMGLVSGFTLQDGTISDAWSLEAPATISITHTTHACSGDGGNTHDYDEWVFKGDDSDELYEKCSVCLDEKATSHGKSHTYTKNYYKHDSENNKDYRVCDDCGYVDLSSVQACVFGAWTDDSASGDHSHHVRTCTNCGIQEIVTVPSMTYTSNADKATHTATCNYCGAGTAKSEDCTPTSWHVIVGGKHEGVCSKCTQTVEKTCDDDANGDGFCDSLEPKGAAAKTKADSILSNAKAKGWQDSYKDSEGKATQAGKDWANGLSDSDLDSLYNEYKDFESKELAAAKSEGGPNIDDYMKTSGATALGEALENAKSPAAVMLGGAVAAPKMGAGPTTFSIEFLDKATLDALSDGSVTLTDTRGGTTTYNKATDTIVINDDPSATTLVKEASNVIKLAQNVEVTVKKAATAPTGHINITTEECEFTPDSTGTISGFSTASSAVFKGTNGEKKVQVLFDLANEVKINLVKEDGSTALPGATVKISDQEASPTVVDYTAGDRVVVGTPTGTGNISKSGSIITIKADKLYEVLQGTTIPSGYKWGDGTCIFKADAAGDGTVSKDGTSTSTTFVATSKSITVQFEKIPEIKFFFWEKGTTTPINTGSITVQSSTTPSNKEVISPSDKVIVNNLTGSTYISRTGTNEVTVRAGETFKILKGTAPVGYINLSSENGDFSTTSAGVVSVTEVPNIVTKAGTTGVNIYFEGGPEYTFTVSGGGAPTTPEYKLLDTLGNSYTITSGKAKLGDGEYILTCTNPKDDYIQPLGTFVLADGKVSSVTGDCQKVSGDDKAINLVINDQLGDLDFTLYAKKSKKDAPDTDEKLKDWDYGTLYYYTGDETEIKSIKKESDSKWKTTKASIKPASGKSTVTIDMSSSKYTGFEIGGIYRMKQVTAPSGYSKDSDYVYFTINAFGLPEILDGDAAAVDDEVQMWNSEADEDSDDVIAVHKVNNTGTELAGAKLQIYLYSDTNTLVYGSSTTTTSSSTTSSSSSTTSSTSSTTKAKTTPTKPSATDVKFEWTTTDKAKTISVDDLEKGKNYTLREVSAPSGYETPAYDFVFKYGTDGKITIVKNYNGLLSVTGNKLVLKNQTPTEAAATRPKTGDHSKLALWLDICIVMLGGLYLSGYSIFEAFTEKKKVKVVAKKKPQTRRKR